MTRTGHGRPLSRGLALGFNALLVCLLGVLAACGGGDGKKHNPVPVLNSVSPTSEQVGSAAFTLTVNGNDFVTGSVVQWNGAARTTTYVGSTKLTATIPATDLASTGAVQITVRNPTPGGGTSAAIPFTISPAVGTAEGLWKGTSGTGRSVAGLVLGSGEYWLIYSAIGNNAVTSGLVQGNGTSQNGQFASSNAIDFNFDGAGTNPATVDATYHQKHDFDGTVKYTGPTSSLTFTTSYQLEYDGSPIMSPLITTFKGTAYGGLTEYTEVTIASSGALTGVSASGCKFAGTITPSTDGNYYNVTAIFQGSPCVNGSSTVTGVAYFDLYERRLTSAALNATRTNAYVFVGTGAPY